MRALVIQNKGELELGALTLLGASTKRGDESKFGMYGSGNKYAIAYLIRNEISIKIWRGLNPIQITTREISLRDKTFQQLCFDGEPTSITTDFGPDWRLWNALREIYTNAIDEDDEAQIYICDNKEDFMKPGYTSFEIELTDEVEDFFNQIKKYFSIHREPIAEFGDIKLYNQLIPGKTLIYRRGVLVRVMDYESCFDYEKGDYMINEQRELITTPTKVLQDVFLKLKNIKLLREFLSATAKDNYFEAMTTVYSWESHDNGEEIISAIGDLYVTPNDFDGESNIPLHKRFYVNKNIEANLYSQLAKHLRFINQRIGGNIGMAFKPTQYQEKLVERALGICYELGFPLNGDRIEYFESSNEYLLGTINGDNVVLTRLVLEKGISELVRTIIEEMLHIESGFSDMTRNFQNYIFDKFITALAKEKEILI